MKKLIIQSDDLGISKAVTDGIVEAVKSGMVRCTGLFANMDSSEYAANRIKDFPEVCLGQDINIVAGKPCSDYKKIPSMVNEKGGFLTSSESRKLDLLCDSHDHLVFEECIIEVEAQVLRFYELMGKYPDYLHGHSYATATLNRAIDTISKKYRIPTTRFLKEKYNLTRPLKDWNQKPFELEDQLNAKPLDAIMQDDYLQYDIGWIVFHCGYVDAPLFDVSTYTLIRTIDLKAVLSKELKDWIDNNHIQLISYKELVTNESMCL